MPEDTRAESTQPKKVEVSFVKEELSKVARLQKEYSPEQLKFARDLINPDLKDSELYIFIDFCGRIQLNPFLKEIIAIVYNKDRPAERTVNYIITRNGKRVVASRTGELGKVETLPIYTKKVSVNLSDSQGQPDLKATDNVKIQPEFQVVRVQAWEGGVLWGAESVVERNGVQYKATVPMSEYNTGRNVWASKPSTMICKVAESQALSMAFPEILGATYDDSELDSMNVKPMLEVAEDKPATPEQIATLRSLKVDVPEGLKYQLAVELMADATKKGAK